MEAVIVMRTPYSSASLRGFPIIYLLLQDVVSGDIMYEWSL